MSNEATTKHEQGIDECAPPYIKKSQHPLLPFLGPPPLHATLRQCPFCPYPHCVTEFRQPLQVQSHLEMSGILVQLGHIQHT